MNQRPWTPDEEAYLKRNYRRHGAQHCATHLNRSPKSIYRKANRLNLTLHPPPGLMYLNDLNPSGSGRHAELLRQRAQRDGVLTCAKIGGRHHHLVPTSWGDHLIQQHEHDHHISSSWYDLHQVAQRLRTTPQHLQRALNDPSSDPTLAPYLQGVASHTTRHGRTYLDPAAIDLNINRTLIRAREP